MLAVIGILACIIAGIRAMQTGVISADTFYLSMVIFTTGLLIREEKKGKGEGDK